MNVYVLYGGKSGEHEVSLQSAMAVINGIDKQKYVVHPVYITQEGVWNVGEPIGIKTIIIDKAQLKLCGKVSVFGSLGTFLLESIKENDESIVFPVLHGPNGEDGTVQGMLEVMNIPYVGNGVLASALGMDKAVAKTLLAKENIPQAEYTILKLVEWQEDKEAACIALEKSMGYPCFVKPARLGSSIGISRCKDRAELETAIEEAFCYDHKLVIEKELQGREMQIAVLGNDRPQSSVVGEFMMERPFMDYNAKYVEGKLVPVIPARLSEETSLAMRETALKVFRLLNCQGIARIDYFVAEDQSYYINEINTMPGFTKQSMTPALWQATDGTSYSELLDKMIALGLEQYGEKQSVRTGR